MGTTDGNGVYTPDLDEEGWDPELASNFDLFSQSITDIATHAGAADPHTGYQKESEKAAASGYASLDGSTKVPVAQLPTGTSSSTVALGDAAAGLISTHAGLGDPHAGYLKESDVAAKGDLYVATANDTVGILSAPATRQQRLGADEAGTVAWAPLSAGPSGVRIWEEMLWQDAMAATTTLRSGAFTIITNGTASATSAVAGEANHPGVQRFDTGTSTTGQAYLRSGVAAIALGGGRARVGFWLKTSASLSDGTNRYEVIAGFADSATAIVDGAYLHYRDNVNSGNWEAVTSSNSVTTVADSGVAVAASTWYFLEIEVNAAGTSVAFYINKSLVATTTTNIPTGAGRETGVLAEVVKSLGTTARTIDWDAVYLELDFTTAR